MPKPFGQSRHRIWSWSSESNTRRRGTSSLHFHCARPANLLELARSLELRSGAYRAPALPVELYQRSWRGDSNADHGLTRPVLFPLRYTSIFNNPGGGGENCTPDDLLCREMPCCLGYTASNLLPKSGAEGGTRTRDLDVGNVASWPLDDFRPHNNLWSEQRESNSRHRVGGPRHQPLYHARPSHLAGVTGFEPARTRFGDERPSHRVITPVAVATGVEPVPPDRQSGILPLDSATTF